MGMQTEGKDKILKSMLSGATVKLGNISGGEFTPIAQTSVNPNYAPMSVVLYDDKVSSPNSQYLYLKVADGVAKNADYDAYFKDADDDKTRDSLTPLQEGGWQDTVTAVGIYKSSTLYYACQFSATPVHVYQGHRIKIGKGQFSLTFNVTEE